MTEVDLRWIFMEENSTKAQQEKQRKFRRKAFGRKERNVKERRAIGQRSKIPCSLQLELNQREEGPARPNMNLKQNKENTHNKYLASKIHMKRRILTMAHGLISRILVMNLKTTPNKNLDFHMQTVGIDGNKFKTYTIDQPRNWMFLETAHVWDIQTLWTQNIMTWKITGITSILGAIHLLPKTDQIITKGL